MGYGRSFNCVIQLLDEVISSISDQGHFTFFITNNQGSVLYASGTETLPEVVKVGASWSKDAVGPNAVAAAIADRRLNCYLPKDHAHPTLKEGFSIAAPIPIYDTEGILAAMGNCLASVTLARALVLSCTRSVESSHRMRQALEKVKLKTKFEDAIIKSITDGFFVLYPDGIVTHANTAGAKMLGVEPEQLIGRRLSDFVESELRVLDIFKTGQPIVDQELFVRLHNKTLHLIKTAVPVHDENGKVIAVIDNFKEIKNVHRLVNRMMGAKASFSFEDIISVSKEMTNVIELARAASQSALSVLIQGESGTGKELFAHAIHNASDRRKGPFVIIDCASIPRELVESELFGYVDGAFTGARKGGRTGKFELANSGTVFLDEIGEMPLEIQAKFLRVLQSRHITRVGGSEVIPVDIRMIAATNRNLQEQVRQKSFREDLFYRLNVLDLHIPALRVRPDDILLLAEYYLKKYSEKLGKRDLAFSDEVKRLLCGSTWPGNVRELENVVARAVHLTKGLITPDQVTFVPQRYEQSSPVQNVEPMSYHVFERNNIIAALKENHGNRTKAAKILGIARSTLYKKLIKFGLS